MKVALVLLFALFVAGIGSVASLPVPGASSEADRETNTLTVAGAGIYDNSSRSETASDQNCVECHAKSHGKMVDAWSSSVHATKGVGCSSCHGSNHSKIFEVKGEVTAGVCGKCHQKQMDEFRQSLHADAITLMKTDSRFHHLTSGMAKESCIRCHDTGRKFSDGTVGSCNSCHSGHAFSIAEARRPESCTQCHSGPDHAQDEMWLSSKHGQLSFSRDTQTQSPTCVTCHMPGGSHNTGIGLTFGTVANGAVLEGSPTHGIKMRFITEEEAERQRALMVKTCLPCHSSRFASESLAAADQVKMEADSLVFEASRLVMDLRKDGLLENEQTARAENPREGYSVEVPDPLAGSPVEQRLFTMVKFSHPSTFKGAYHHSPSHTYTKGFLQLQQDLNFIKAEARRIRNSQTKPD